MMELHKGRKALTEYETRYYMKQILEGVNYLQQNKIIHKDLKLGHLLLSDDRRLWTGHYTRARRLTEKVMQLTNGTVQINFLDHTKIIMCPLMAAVTYIDSEKNFNTCRFHTIQENGCCTGLAINLAHSYEKLVLMLSNLQMR